MKIRPLHDWAVINRVDSEEKTAGGIIIPVMAREKPADGVVEAIGPGKYSAQGERKKGKFVPTVVKPGERVVFTDFMAKDVEVEGRKVTLVREEDILGIYEGGGHLVRKESHPVSVGKERPPLIPERTSGKSAVFEEPRSGAAVSSKASGKKKATGKKTPKKAVRPPVRKKTESGKGAVKKKKEKTGKAKTAAGKALKKAVKKTTGKTARGKGTKSAPRAAVAKKTGVKKKAVPTKPLARKKAVSRKKTKPGKR